MAAWSLFEISKIYIEQKDFYQAEHCLSTRAMYYGWITKESASEQGQRGNLIKGSGSESAVMFASKENASQNAQSTKKRSQDSQNSNDEVSFTTQNKKDKHLVFTADSDIFVKYRAFEKLVKAIILLMKRKIEKARHLLEQIKQPSLPS